MELVTTDGFLFPNKELEARGLMRRKGFPESYDIRHLVEFVANIRAGHEKVEAPSTPTSSMTSCPTRRRWWSSRTS